jgi:two-component system, NtrC family, response regulator AtoC
VQLSDRMIQRDVEVTARTKAVPLRGPCLVILGERVIAHRLPDAGTVTIGRHPTCDVVIDDPSVSRRHALVHLDGLRIEDLGSANGTRIGGGAIGAGAPVPIAFDQVVRIGGVAMLIQRPGDTTPVGTVAGDRPTQPIVADLDPAGAMARLHDLVDRVAASTISVLILGETGVGKEVLAELVHTRSSRAARPFLRLNCAALAETLLESELFGHEKGAFTGAVETKAGLLETAQGGTVFLDEIGELPPSTQAKLLRVIEQRELLRVGGLRARPIDVRFIAATHRDLGADIERGTFRRDLYFRLNGITLSIPPLRDRPAEIEALARRFAIRAAASLGRSAPPALSAEALVRLRGHPWPGNIRELRNVMDRAVLLASDRIDAEHLMVEAARVDVAVSVAAPRVQAGSVLAEAPAGDLAEVRRRTLALEREHILAALARAAGNQKVAAQMLGISRRTLITKLERHAIDRPRKRATPPPPA